MLASSSAKPPNRATKATATSSWEVERSTCSCSVIISYTARLGSRERTSRISAVWTVCRGCVVRMWMSGSREILEERNIEKRPGRFIHAVVFRISDDADNLHPIAFHLQTLADGILPAPIPRDHGLVDDGDTRRVFIVRASEFAPGDERNAQSGEVVGADFVIFRRGLLVRRRLVAVDGNGRRRE